MERRRRRRVQQADWWTKLWLSWIVRLIEWVPLFCTSRNGWTRNTQQGEPGNNWKENHTKPQSTATQALSAGWFGEERPSKTNCLKCLIRNTVSIAPCVCFRNAGLPRFLNSDWVVPPCEPAAGWFQCHMWQKAKCPWGFWTRWAFGPIQQVS